PERAAGARAHARPAVAGGRVRFRSRGGHCRRRRSASPPVPAFDERSGDQGPARAEFFLLPESAAGRRPGPRAAGDASAPGASQLTFRTERQRLYQRGQAMLAEDLPWLPVYVRLQWAVARPEVKGFRLHPTGIPRLDGVSLDLHTSIAPAPGATP